MAAKLVENIRINNRKPFIFQYFTDSFAFSSFAGENEAEPFGYLTGKMKFSF